MGVRSSALGQPSRILLRQRKIISSTASRMAATARLANRPSSSELRQRGSSELCNYFRKLGSSRFSPLFRPSIKVWFSSVLPFESRAAAWSLVRYFCPGGQLRQLEDAMLKDA